MMANDVAKHNANELLSTKTMANNVATHQNNDI